MSRFPIFRESSSYIIFVYILFLIGFLNYLTFVLIVLRKGSVNSKVTNSFMLKDINLELFFTIIFVRQGRGQY